VVLFGTISRFFTFSHVSRGREPVVWQPHSTEPAKRAIHSRAFSPIHETPTSWAPLLVITLAATIGARNIWTHFGVFKHN